MALLILAFMQGKKDNNNSHSVKKKTQLVLMQLTEVLPEEWELPATKAEVAMTYGLGSTPASSPCPFFVPQS